MTGRRAGHILSVAIATLLLPAVLNAAAPNATPPTRFPWDRACLPRLNLYDPEGGGIVGYQQEDLTEAPRLWTRSIPIPERNSRFELLAAADAYFRGFETNGTPEYIPAPLLPEADRRENGILYTNTRIGSSQLSTARSGFDAGRFKGMQVRDRRYPEVDAETGAVMSLVRFGDPLGPLPKASLPLDRQGKAQQAPDVMVGASFVSEIFAVSQGKIAEIHAYWIPSEGRVATPWATGSVPVRDW